MTTADDGNDTKDLTPVVRAIEALTRAVTEGAAARNALLAECVAQLRGCNAALHGQWSCCLGGNESNDLLLRVSMLHYKLLPDERWRLYERLRAEASGAAPETAPETAPEAVSGGARPEPA